MLKTNSTSAIILSISQPVSKIREQIIQFKGKLINLSQKRFRDIPEAIAQGQMSYHRIVQM